MGVAGIKGLEVISRAHLAAEEMIGGFQFKGNSGKSYIFKKGIRKRRLRVAIFKGEVNGDVFQGHPPQPRLHGQTDGGRGLGFLLKFEIEWR